MKDTPFSPLTPACIDWQAETPVARDYDDPYFSRQDGMAESRYVFLEGNQLAQRFSALAGNDYFVIGETGFGTGLNCLLAGELFLHRAPATARLHLLSVEKHPLPQDDLRRALSHWPQLQPLAEPLLAQYPPATPGVHRLQLHPQITLTLLYGEAETLWPLMDHAVDAWFLDGFAPACNPDMWQPALFAQLARLSRPGTTLATFTAAGFVRRGLSEAGFTMHKRDGFGHKRHMLAGYWQQAESQARQQRIDQAIVIGAGLAGATTARALAERGWQVTVLDPNGIATGASGNLAGVVYSTPSAHLTAQNRFYQNSYSQALRWFKQYQFPASSDDGRLNGVIQHAVDERQWDKLSQAMASGAWPDSLLRPAGEQAVELVGGGYIRPARWCAHLLAHPRIHLRQAPVVAVHEGAPAGVELENGEALSARAVVICTAAASRELPGLQWLPLKLIRGQVSYCQATEASRRWHQARCHGGYLTPALDGLHCVGATFDLHDRNPAVKAEDNRQNLQQLEHYLPALWRQLGGAAIQVADQRVAFRCQSIDFLPLCGALPVATDNPHRPATGLYLNLAHGSRGITGTPLCAELLADRICGLPLPVDKPLLDALDPARFIVRKRKKQPEWMP
ncbi:MAG: bifunctional tRNA (5-methylaminomethyl-2-thiouridine)(34)-methyltransferase MnmD/FAD-dependent 5-carboxymethylaminomethyl-2-thiouridine(34) oxidoreductase MnmC [Alcanivorax sp.]|nr:bifunctional tRNA (5-methylaminomethyl-2-thiouridine)(34)-methyltransferase MnmD/FAD-dependent 5-carboxymethylaminomethyl-2-thiouridine(34) oxidoreductase MnmC [Alcanivorax sp.]